MSRSDQTSLSREDELRHTDSPMAWLALYIRNTNSPAFERALALMGTKPAARSSKSKCGGSGAREPPGDPRRFERAREPSFVGCRRQRNSRDAR